MLSLAEGKKLVNIARKELDSYLSDKEVEKWDVSGLDKKQGAFVTLLTYPEKNLRGCIGFPVPQMPLWQSVREAAKAAAFEDPRFLPLSKSEIDRIIIEISVLTKPRLIKVKKPEDLFSEIEIGKDGLILEYSGRSGLFLPQVPVENKWDTATYLSQLCIKAGVSPKTWTNTSCKISKFQAKIFAEKSPKGEIEEIKL
jgi:hypothetical protein